MPETRRSEDAAFHDQIEVGTWWRYLSLAVYFALSWARSMFDQSPELEDFI